MFPNQANRGQSRGPGIELPDQQALGPGEWFTIHKLAKRATNEQKKRAFVEFINDLCEEMRCNRCKEHMTDYIRNNPFGPFWNVRDVDGTQIGMFKWAWIFHNSVNDRLGKPYVDWDTAKRLYYTPNPSSPGPFKCTSGACPPEVPQKFSVLQALSRTETLHYKGEQAPQAAQVCKFGICKI